LDLRVKAAGDWFKNFDLLEADIFDQRTVGWVDTWIHISDGPALIYCDNGDKPKELEWYAPTLRKGDVIAAHDFGNEYSESELPDLERFNRIKSDWLTDTHIIAFEKAGS
jgi:hypothetical protein